MNVDLLNRMYGSAVLGCAAGVALAALGAKPGEAILVGSLVASATITLSWRPK